MHAMMMQCMKIMYMHAYLNQEGYSAMLRIRAGSPQVVCGIEPIKRDIHSYDSNTIRKPPSDHNFGLEPIKRDIHSYDSNTIRKPPSDHNFGLEPIKSDIHSYDSNTIRKPPSDHNFVLEPIKRDIHSYAQ